MFSKKNNFFVFLLFVFLVALFLRIYKLDSVPYGFHVDEAKVGWNAYSIFKTGMDDKGNKLPLYYDSFGDFRPAGLIYLVIPSIAVFGNTVFAVRLPFALIGALTTIVLFIFVLEVFGKQKKYLALIAVVLLALNPWHIIASRATSESIVVIFLTILGLYFFIKLFRNNNLVNMFLSYFSFVLAFGFYHNIRVLAPIFLLILIFFYKLVFLKKIKLKQILIFIALILTTGLIFLSPEARGRASQVSIKSDFKVLYEITKMPNEEGPDHVLVARIFHNRIASYIRRIAEEYKEYFGTSFLTGDNIKPVRYMVPQIGLITYFELILVFLGIFWASRKKEILMVLVFLIVSPLPAAITIEDTPNMQRAIFMIPFLLIVAANGFYGLIKLPPKWKCLSVLIGIGYFCNFIYFSHMYFVHQKMSIASYYRNGGNVELVKKLNEIQNNYKKILITNSPDSLYPWMAFLEKIDPVLFNQSYKNMDKGVRKFENIVFSSDKCPLDMAIIRGEKEFDSVLYVEAEGCEIENKFEQTVKVDLLETIKRPDNSPPYYLRTAKLLR